MSGTGEPNIIYGQVAAEAAFLSKTLIGYVFQALHGTWLQERYLYPNKRGNRVWRKNPGGFGANRDTRIVHRAYSGYLGE